jgi:hypothetical protein
VNEARLIAAVVVWLSDLVNDLMFVGHLQILQAAATNPAK